MSTGLRLKRATPFAIAIAIWFLPVPAGLTAPAWQLFAVFAAAIASVLLGAFPLLTASMLAAGAVVLTETITPAQAYSGFANSSVPLVVVVFIVAQAVVKSGLGRRISLFMVSRFGGSSLGLAYSIVLTDAAIAPAFPSNTARGACSSRSSCPWPRARARARRPRRPAAGRLPHVLRDGEPRGLLRALDDGHLGQPDRRADRAEGRARDRVREVVARLFGVLADRDRTAAPARRETLPAARGQDPRGPRGGAQGTRRHGDAVARRNGSRPQPSS
jgi:Sodium:sulfate symporter transmembrane region